MKNIEKNNLKKLGKIVLNCEEAMNKLSDIMDKADFESETFEITSKMFDKVQKQHEKACEILKIERSTIIVGEQIGENEFRCEPFFVLETNGLKSERKLVYRTIKRF